MQNPERITVNNATYVLESSCKSGPLTMLVLHRGFIYVGEWDEEGAFS